MAYIICDKDNKTYITFDNNNKVTITTDFNKAKVFSDIVKANNVLKNNVKNVKHISSDYIFNVHCIRTPKGNAVCPAEEIELNYDLDDKFEELKNITEELELRRNYALDQIQKLDLELEDIEHAAEFYNLNASHGYKIYKLLHDVRVSRRKYKNELEKINLILGVKFQSDCLDKVIKNSNKMLDKSYCPRINKELFNV